MLFETSRERKGFLIPSPLVGSWSCGELSASPQPEVAPAGKEPCAQHTGHLLPGQRLEGSLSCFESSAQSRRLGSWVGQHGRSWGRLCPSHCCSAQRSQVLSWHCLLGSPGAHPHLRSFHSLMTSQVSGTAGLRASRDGCAWAALAWWTLVLGKQLCGWLKSGGP